MTSSEGAHSFTFARKRTSNQIQRSRAGCANLCAIRAHKNNVLGNVASHWGASSNFTALTCSYSVRCSDMRNRGMRICRHRLRHHGLYVSLHSRFSNQVAISLTMTGWTSTQMALHSSRESRDAIWCKLLEWPSDHTCCCSSTRLVRLESLR